MTWLWITCVFRSPDVDNLGKRGFCAAGGVHVQEGLNVQSRGLASNSLSFNILPVTSYSRIFCEQLFGIHRS